MARLLFAALSLFGSFISVLSCGASEPTESLDRLKERLHKGDDDAKQQAAATLASLGPKAKAAVPDLVRALKDKNAEVRVKVAEALAQVGKDAAPALPTLIEMAEKETDVRLCRRCVLAIGHIPGDRAKAVPILAKLLSAKDDAKDECRLQDCAAICLARIGASAKDAAPALFLAARSGDHTLRVLCLHALGSIPASHERLVPELIALLRDPSQKRVWPAAVGAVQMTGSAGRGAIPSLIGVFQYGHYPSSGLKVNVQSSVLSALASLKAGDTHAEWVLSVGKDERTGEAVRNQAFRSLAVMAPLPDKALRKLVACLNSADELSRYTSVILFAIVANGKRAVGPLMAHLDTRDDLALVYVINGLRRLGGSAEKALPSLRKLADSDNRRVAREARWAVEAIERDSQ